ncbi:uncharacterized protein LOC106170511 [Lingula anatina]|uniref:Uncharacterized protein LOC106170511 n=1 Tax=Lingula anatina TaxID=7574 RepID=A0A1S3J6B3_LINAN|nr:uncharacterized protein LOC106170511 [Lingula anatina]|eukprot:XP_013405848.1 uncharacterized protein LOC106170511 [Lingula anatina]
MDENQDLLQHPFTPSQDSANCELERKCRLRQNELFVHLNINITKEALEAMKQLSRGVFCGARTMEDYNTYKLLNVLEDGCHIRVGQYELLKELLKKSGVARFVEDVEKAEDDIRKLCQRALCPPEVFDGDPDHVKALKEHYEKICTALQKVSTLADVTKTLKRHKILDDQHRIGTSGHKAAQKLMNIVMNKRNKGLRAMRVLACALLRAGQEELAFNILTTQYSWERGAGRDVWIPRGMRKILSAYLEITENLSEPDLHLVLDHLVSKRMVSEDERAAILQQPSRVEKVQEMLDTLLSGGREGVSWYLYDALLLVEQDDMADGMLISWPMLEWELLSRYRYDQRELIHDISIRKEPITISWERDPPSIISQPATATRMATEDRVVSWKVTESRHGSFLKSTICGQWVNSGAESGQREWGGYKAVIDIETVEEILGSHAMKRGQTVQEILASMPDVPKETLFILNVTQRPDLKTKWKRLLAGKIFPGAKVLLFEGSDDQGIKRGGKKRKLNGCSCELNGEGIEGPGLSAEFLSRFVDNDLGTVTL